MKCGVESVVCGVWCEEWRLESLERSVEWIVVE